MQGNLHINSTWYKTRTFKFLRGEPFLQGVSRKTFEIPWKLQLTAELLASVLQCLFKCKHRYPKARKLPPRSNCDHYHISGGPGSSNTFSFAIIGQCSS